MERQPAQGWMVSSRSRETGAKVDVGQGGQGTQSQSAGPTRKTGVPGQGWTTNKEDTEVSERLDSD